MRLPSMTAGQLHSSHMRSSTPQCQLQKRCKPPLATWYDLATTARVREQAVYAQFEPYVLAWRTHLPRPLFDERFRGAQLAPEELKSMFTPWLQGTT